MAHNCIDWTTRPPTRKIPLLTLSRGDDCVYSIVPKEFKALEDIARTEFNLGDVDVKISSSCVNLCSGLPARITESTWEHVSAYIGCATIEVVAPRTVEAEVPQEQPTPAENVVDERHAVAREKPPLNAGEHDHGLGGRPNTSLGEAVRDEQIAPSGHRKDQDRPATPENQPEEPWEEEVSAVSPRKLRFHRRVVSENEDEGHESGEGPAQSQAPVSASPPRPSIQVKKERKSDHRSEPEPQPTEEPDRPIKQEKRNAVSSGNGSHSQPQSQPSRSQAPADSSDTHKLMIRVAHRASKQESKFTTKSTTKVHKVLVSACKSFSLDASRATLYLIVSMEDDEGEVENLFPCDKNDTIARAGAERDVESRFLLKIGEP